MKTRSSASKWTPLVAGLGALAIVGLVTIWRAAPSIEADWQRGGIGCLFHSYCDGEWNKLNEQAHDLAARIKVATNPAWLRVACPAYHRIETRIIDIADHTRRSYISYLITDTGNHCEGYPTTDGDGPK